MKTRKPCTVRFAMPLATVLSCLSAAPAQAALLDHMSVSILSSGGTGGTGASTSDMIFDRFTSDGWGWAGGAGGVQGSLAAPRPEAIAVPANETLKFNLGTTVDALNGTYGAGNWTIANPTLTFTSSYEIQLNPRFTRGSGSFDIYWVANDNWAQSKGTLTDRQLNPVYATSAAGLSGWSGSQALLGSEYFSSSGTGYVNLSYDLALAPLLVNDILSASATGANQSASLYLMATSDTIGMIIFTGGQGQPLPTLSFDVVSAVPLPPSVWLFGSALAGLGLAGRRKGRLASSSFRHRAALSAN